FNQQVTDPLLRSRWMETGTMLLLVIGAAFAAGWLVDLIFLPLRRKIYQAKWFSSWTRFGGVIGWLGLSLAPVITFLAVALLVIDYHEPTKLARYIVMTVVYALAVLRLVRVFSRFFLAPRVPSLRFLPISTEVAETVQNWVTWFGAVMVFGFFTAEIAKTVKVPVAAVTGFTNLVALTVVGMTIGLIVRKRSAISLFIRGDLSAARAHGSLIDSMRLWLARTWHALAITYLVVGYIVTMLGAGGGFAIMQQGTIGTLLALFGMRLSFYWVTKLAYKKQDPEVSSGLYRTVLRILFKMLTGVLGTAAILASWGVDVSAIASSAWGQRVMGSAFSIASTILIVVFIYELMRAAIERNLNKRDANGRVIQANSRARTILPMVQKAAVIILGVIAVLVTLAELGINIAPLLAGAGVLGVAVGFGSQTLIKDFLTGLSIILEDNLAVGDSVIIEDCKGVVENLSIRTVRIRDVNGSLHILPFSAITVITNESKIFAYALMDIGVSYDSDLDMAITVLNKTGEEMLALPEFKDIILDKIEVFGVESLGDSSVVIRSRIKTKAGSQGIVRRGFLLRIKRAFDAAGVDIPYPTVMHVTRPPAMTSSPAVSPAADVGDEG
ncbi:MAG TPA: hypothetical protein DCY07_08075, partial [Rhodospirillaceae bacterium]|nr:hypothetical protein [Rhodospirillaceae bacterium]